MRQNNLPGFELGDYIRESIAFLREHEPPEGYFVGFSGGKDSIVTLELCRMAGVKHQAYYSCTRIDPPEMYVFIKKNYPAVTWLFPKTSFYEAIRKKRPPLRMQRWCCDFLKKDPSKSIPLKNRIVGIRAEESIRRASRPRIDSFNKITLFKPIFTWKEWAVWEFIEAFNLPYPSLYDEGLSRIGCVFCPFILGSGPKKTQQRAWSQKHYPGIWKAVEKSVKSWWAEKRGEIKKRPHGETAESYWHDYLLGFENRK